MCFYVICITNPLYFHDTLHHIYFFLKSPSQHPRLTLVDEFHRYGQRHVLKSHALEFSCCHLFQGTQRVLVNGIGFVKRHVYIDRWGGSWLFLVVIAIILTAVLIIGSEFKYGHANFITHRFINCRCCGYKRPGAVGG